MAIHQLLVSAGAGLQQHRNSHLSVLFLLGVINPLPSGEQSPLHL